MDKEITRMRTARRIAQRFGSMARRAGIRGTFGRNNTRTERAEFIALASSAEMAAEMAKTIRNRNK